jgi:hypothetical protein
MRRRRRRRRRMERETRRREWGLVLPCKYLLYDLGLDDAAALGIAGEDGAISTDDNEGDLEGGVHYWFHRGRGMFSRRSYNTHNLKCHAEEPAYQSLTRFH